MIPFIDLATQKERLKEQLDAAWQRVLTHGQYLNGPEIKEAEQAIADYCGVDEAVMVSSGSDALVLALRALGVGPGDSVYVPDFTFIATVQAVVTVGAKPILVDIDRDTLALDTRSLPSPSQYDSPQPAKALIAVDLYGQPADYRLLKQYCDKHQLYLIADAAQSFGAEYQGRRTGSLADLTTFSFYPAKPLGVNGDGGAVVTSDKKLAHALRMLREHGADPEDRYHHMTIGYNARMDSIQAGVLLAKLSIFDDELNHRREIAKRYSSLLSGISGVTTPITHEDSSSSWSQYTVRVPKNRRDALIQYLKAAGIPTCVHYQFAVHEQPAYQHIDCLSPCTESKKAAQEVLSLPMHPYLDQQSQDHIIETIKSFFA